MLLTFNSSILGILEGSLLAFIAPHFLKYKSKWLNTFIIAPLISLLLLLILSNSRAGWFGCICSLVFIGHIQLRKNRKKTIFPTVLVLFFTLLFLLFYKSDSSKGRRHIYSITFSILTDSWPKGIGPNKFKSKFNEYQADYFSKHSIDNERALLSDNTFYAFNEYLQWVTELGLPGSMVLALCLFLFTKRIVFLRCQYYSKPFLLSAASAIICIAIASLFSYPLRVIPIQSFALFSLALLVFIPSGEKNISTWYHFEILTLRLFSSALVLIHLANFTSVNRQNYLEMKALDCIKSGDKRGAIEKLYFLIHKYPTVGYYNYLLAKQLYYINNLPNSYSILKAGMEYYIDNQVYKLKGTIELELKKFTDAEQSFIRAIYMVPNRMSSRFDLLMFYIGRNDTVKAKFWSHSILSMQIKVQSPKTEHMLKQTAIILNNL
jgi:O-antigen polymerase